MGLNTARSRINRISTPDDTASGSDLFGSMPAPGTNPGFSTKNSKISRPQELLLKVVNESTVSLVMDPLGR